MDEIDAALDFRNVSIVANYIAERTKDAQFVIISLRNNMFELADRLVGIYKTSHCTKSIAINPNMVATLTAIPNNTSPNTGKKPTTPPNLLPTALNNASSITSSSPAIETEESVQENTDQPSEISSA
jgi:structural maintenance of chromosome 4